MGHSQADIRERDGAPVEERAVPVLDGVHLRPHRGVVDDVAAVQLCRRRLLARKGIPGAPALRGDDPDAVVDAPDRPRRSNVQQCEWHEERAHVSVSLAAGTRTTCDCQ